MSGTFKGFTEKDIESLRNPKRDVSTTFTKKTVLKPKAPVTLRKMTGVAKFELIDPNAKLSKETESEKAAVINIPDDNVPSAQIDITSEPNPLEANNNVNNHDMSNTEFVEVILSVNNDHGHSNVEKHVNLDEFHKQQKLIEEQNRKKREMLSKALEDRSKQTAEEVNRLNSIKKELQTLDLQLSDDVSIIRKKIDNACLVYAEAEKHYLRAEKEFLIAKIRLQKEKDKKELLTEHLCTLIAHNEARKAKKLESLMDQLAYNVETSAPSSRVVDGVCERTGKMVEMEDENNENRED